MVLEAAFSCSGGRCESVGAALCLSEILLTSPNNNHNNNNKHSDKHSDNHSDKHSDRD